MVLQGAPNVLRAIELTSLACANMQMTTAGTSAHKDTARIAIDCFSSISTTNVRLRIAIAWHIQEVDALSAQITSISTGVCVIRMLKDVLNKQT